MANKKFNLIAISASLLVALSGCYSYMPESKKIDYKSAQKGSTLEIPPDLTQISSDDKYVVSNFGSQNQKQSSASFLAYSAERANENAVNKSNNFAYENTEVLPQINQANSTLNMRIIRDGNSRWLQVQEKPTILWERVKDFWQDIGFIIDVERPAAGIMETDWAENRAKIPDDIIRRTLGKFLDSIYSTGERDKFRTRFEISSNNPGYTDIFISHRGMEEVYTSSAKDDTRWQNRPVDRDLEAEMLQRLMLKLSNQEFREQELEKLQQQQKIAEVQLPQRAFYSVQQNMLTLDEPFDRSWRRLGLALDRIGFTVEDRNRAEGVYFVRYVDSDNENYYKKSEKGFLSKLAFWRSDDDDKDKNQSKNKNSARNDNEEIKNFVIDNKTQFKIRLTERSENASEVQVLNVNNEIDHSTSSQKILNLLFNELK